MPRPGTNVYRRTRDNRWVAILSPTDSPDGRKHAFYGKTRQEALTARKDGVRRLEQGYSPKPVKQTVGEWLEEWLETCVKPDAAANTYQSRETNIRLHLKPVIGHLKLEQLTPSHLRKLYAEKAAAGYKPNSIDRMHDCLRCALSQAVKDRLIRENVASLVSVPTPQSDSLKHFTPAEATRFIEAARGEPLGEYLITLLLTGLRKSELIGITWDQVDLDRRQFTLRVTKPRPRLRTVPLMPELVTILRDYKPAQQRTFLLLGWEWKPSGYVFPAQRSPNRLAVSMPNKAMEAVTKKAGLPSIPVHGLRHSTASLLFAMGAEMKDVQEILGHADISITSNLYTHLMPERKQAVVDRLSSLFEESK
jgi:integrase